MEGLTTSERLVLLALADFADNAGRCWPSKRKLSEMCRISPRNVKRHLASAESKGLLEVEDRYHTQGGQRSNGYHLLSHHLDGGGIAAPRGGCHQRHGGDGADDTGGVSILTRGGCQERPPLIRNPNHVHETSNDPSGDLASLEAQIQELEEKDALSKGERFSLNLLRNHVKAAREGDGHGHPWRPTPRTGEGRTTGRAAGPTESLAGAGGPARPTTNTGEKETT